MSAADRHQPQPAPPSADQLRMFFQSMQQQFQPPTSTPQNKSGNSGTNEKLSPSLDENNVMDLIMNNPDYQRLLNYSQMNQNTQSAPVQHPLAAAAANPENPAFRALIAHSSGGGSALPFGVYPNFVPEMHPEMLAANPYYANGGMPFGPYMSGMDAGRRKNATREVTMPLKKWLSDHRRYPYPNKAEKMILAIITKMSLTQVSTWFANARRRLKKENKMTWSPRCRPGGEDEDDEDLEDNEPLSPSISINSSDEIKRDAPTTNSFDGQKSSKREHPDSNNDEAPTPKRKILSVNDMLSNSSRQSPSRVEKCKSPPRSTTPPSSSSDPNHNNPLANMPPMGQFAPPAGQFPFPFGANPAQQWNPQMMAIFAAQNAARSQTFNGMPQMNPNFLQQMMAVQQMANFMRSGPPTLPPQLNPNMLAAMQGFFPSTTAPSTSIQPPTPTMTKPSNRPESSSVKPVEQSPSVVNTSSSSVSENNTAETQQANSTDEATTTTTINVKKDKSEDSQSSSPKPQSQPSKPVAAH